MMLSVNITVLITNQNMHRNINPYPPRPGNYYQVVLQRTTVIAETHESGGVKSIKRPKGKLVSRLGVPPRCFKLCQLTFACTVWELMSGNDHTFLRKADTNLARDRTDRFIQM